MAEKEKKKVSVSSLLATEGEPRKYVEPDEWYKATLEKAEPGTGNYGPYIKFFFKLLDGQLENSSESAKGVQMQTIIDASLSPGKRLWEWLKVMINEEPKVGENYDLTTFYGEKFRILIRDKKKNANKEGGPRYQIIDGIKRPKPKTETETGK